MHFQRRQWQPTPVILPGKSHGQRSLVGCSPWGREESDTTERLHFHFSLSCIGEGNGHPLQCSCLENPRDRGAWWAAICGVTQSWTRLRQLRSSSSSGSEGWCAAIHGVAKRQTRLSDWTTQAWTRETTWNSLWNVSYLLKQLCISLLPLIYSASVSLDLLLSCHLRCKEAEQKEHCCRAVIRVR